MDRDETFTCRARVTALTPQKCYITEDEKTVAKEAVNFTAYGVKDPIFGPATPMFQVQTTIQNPQVAEMLRKAFEREFLQSSDPSVIGMELEVVFRVLGPSRPDTY